MDDEGDNTEVEQQVLAAPADSYERVPVGGIGRWNRGLECGEGQRAEPFEGRSRVGGTESLCMGLDLRELRHAASPGRGVPHGGERVVDRSQVAGVGEHRPQVSAETQPAIHECHLGGERALSNGGSGGSVLREGDVGRVIAPGPDSHSAVSDLDCVRHIRAIARDDLLHHNTEVGGTRDSAARRIELVDPGLREELGHAG